MEGLIGNPTTFVSEMIWTVINFFLLYFLLKRFLFTPIIKFSEERKAKMDAKFAVEQNAKEQVAQNNDRLLTEKMKSRDEAKRILAEAGDAREKRHAEAASEAKANSVKLLKDGREELLKRREETAGKLHDAAPDLAELLAKRLMHEE